MSLIESSGESELVRIQRALVFEARVARGRQNFTGDSAVDLFLEIQGAAQRMVNEGRTTGPDLDEARQAVVTFLNRMEEERVQLGFSEFHEETVYRARLSLCPGLWPFC